jgi:hypothetical protein
MQEYFKQIGLQRADAIISCTPDIDNVTRGQQIQAWLEKHPEVTRYAIIDDNSDMTEEQLEHHFVHTCTKTALHTKTTVRSKRSWTVRTLRKTPNNA